MRHWLFHIILAVAFFAICSFATAQPNDWRSHLEQLAEEGLNSATIENMFQELTMLEGNPMNLNRVTLEQLERFPLVSNEQAAHIIEFLEKNRPLYTVFELRNVPYLDFNTVELILPFFFVGETEEELLTVEQMLDRGRHEVQFRLDKTLQERAGYGEFSDSILERYPNRKYRGEDFYTSVKYGFTYRDKLQAGFVAEKDPGEPFLRKEYPMGYDHYGFHLIVRDLGRLKTLAVGDYRLSFGQGLILNNDFSLSKSWGTNAIIRHTQEPKRHFSSAESGYFRGAAALFEVGRLTVTPFYSNKRFDANLSDDGTITSFKTDGYHRTPLEIEKKSNAYEQVAGININYRNGQFQIGASGLYHIYSQIYSPVVREYNYYSFRGRSHGNASVDYSYRFNRLTVAGETALSGNGAIASSHMVQYTPSGLFSLSALYRHFPISYNAMHAQAFSDGSQVRNERGFYLGSNFKPLRKVSVTGYIDLIRFPWPKSQVDKPSSGIDLYFLGTYTISRDSRLELRYKFNRKEQNATYPDEDYRTVLPYNTQKIRLRYNHALKSGWDFTTTLDGAFYRQRHFPVEKGFMLSQHAGYRGGKKIRADIYAGYFNSDTYASRLYSYEKNILSTFYMPSFYGKGTRLAISGRYSITSRLSFSAKIGHTRYFNRDTIGTGTEEISGKRRTDLFTYWQWRF